MELLGCCHSAQVHGDQEMQSIEVLAEESGPGGAYLTARNVTTGQVGFYPAGWVRHPERGVPAQGPVAC